ncbi:PepSY domain-containing protein [Rhodovulum sp.]|uniref:PepSY domain-containing protein n=1 Tax=Rhodovulum sp. TaxID=34009 RepID=UPI0039C94A2D
MHVDQPVAGGAAQAIAQALPGEDLHRQPAAIFSRHHAPDGFQQVRADAAVIHELLAAVMDPDAGAGTGMRVLRARVGVLKPAPVADVVDIRWTVRKFEIDDGRYEIKGRDSDGRQIEVKLDPATLQVVEMALEGDDRRGGARTPAPAGSIATPQNGLSGNGVTPQMQAN